MLRETALNLADQPKARTEIEVQKGNPMNQYFIDPNKTAIGAEDPAEFVALRDQIVKDHSAKGCLEILAAEQIAVNMWRLRRAQETEARAISGNDTGAAMKVAAYIKDVDGAFHRAVRQLMKLQADRRKAAADQARAQAANAAKASDELLERLLGPVEMPIASEIGFVSQNGIGTVIEPEPVGWKTESSGTPERHPHPNLSRHRNREVPSPPGTLVPPEHTRNTAFAAN